MSPTTARAITERRRATRKTKRARKAKKARKASLPPRPSRKRSPPNPNQPAATSLRANKSLTQRSGPHLARPLVFKQKLTGVIGESNQRHRQQERRERDGPAFFSDQRLPDVEDRPRQRPITTRSTAHARVPAP